MNPKMEYVIIKTPDHGYLVVMQSLLPFLSEYLDSDFTIMKSLIGSELTGLQYKTLFENQTKSVYAADFVTAEIGTGLVHIAPGHGQDDYELAKLHNLPVYSIGTRSLVPLHFIIVGLVDDAGRFANQMALLSK